MIKVYFSSFSKRLSNSDFYRYLNLLPTEIKQKIIRFQRWEDQHASLYGKLLLMKALEESGLRSDLLNLKYNLYGRPFLESSPDFNISHSGFFSVCVLSLQGRIGVDIEEMKPISVGNFDQEFSNDEWKTISGAENSNYCFYNLWTAKEAVSKADGRGLHLPFKKINIKDNKTIIDNTLWFIKRIAIDDNYMLQTAVDQVIDSDINLLKVSY